MRYVSLLIIFSMLCIANTKGQHVITDSSDTSKETISNDTDSNESQNNNIEYLPKDMMFIPSDVLYNHVWENYRISYNSEVFVNKKDTVVIVLNDPEENEYVHPVNGKIISPFGPRGSRIHTGIDIKLQLGDSVLCAFDGKVRLARVFHGYRNVVLVRHKNGLETLYGHLSKICVKENDIVNAGDLIGFGGRTGRATTEHLHFETRLLGEPFNSEKYIDFNKCALKCDTLFFNNHDT